MSDQNQLSLETAGTAPTSITPDVDLLDLSDPTLTPEQNERYDRLVDNNGVTRIEALRVIGAPLVDHETEKKPTRVGAFIVSRGDLPNHAHFGAWKEDA